MTATILQFRPYRTWYVKLAYVDANEDLQFVNSTVYATDRYDADRKARLQWSTELPGLNLYSVKHVSVRAV